MGKWNPEKGEGSDTFFKLCYLRGDRVAQSVKHLGLAQVMIRESWD